MQAFNHNSVHHLTFTPFPFHLYTYIQQQAPPFKPFRFNIYVRNYTLNLSTARREQPDRLHSPWFPCWIQCTCSSLATFSSNPSPVSYATDFNPSIISVKVFSNSNTVARSFSCHAFTNYSFTTCRSTVSCTVRKDEQSGQRECSNLLHSYRNITAKSNAKKPYRILNSQSSKPCLSFSLARDRWYRFHSNVCKIYTISCVAINVNEISKVDLCHRTIVHHAHGQWPSFPFSDWSKIWWRVLCDEDSNHIVRCRCLYANALLRQWMYIWPRLVTEEWYLSDLFGVNINFGIDACQWWTLQWFKARWGGQSLMFTEISSWFIVYSCSHANKKKQRQRHNQSSRYRTFRVCKVTN